MRKRIVLIVSIVILITQGCDTYKGVQRRANDDMAISLVKKIRKSQTEFEIRHGKGNFASLEKLIEENSVSQDLADGVDQGYKYVLKVGVGNYSLQAIPVEYGTENSEGNFSLYLNESGAIRSATKKGVDMSSWEIAGPNSIPIKE